MGARELHEVTTHILLCVYKCAFVTACIACSDDHTRCTHQSFALPRSLLHHLHLSRTLQADISLLVSVFSLPCSTLQARNVSEVSPWGTASAHLMSIHRMLMHSPSNAACSASLQRYIQASLMHPGMLSLANANASLRAGPPVKNPTYVDKVAFAIDGECAQGLGRAMKLVQGSSQTGSLPRSRMLSVNTAESHLAFRSTCIAHHLGLHSNRLGSFLHGALAI